MDSDSKFSIHSICRICLKQLESEKSFDLFCVPGLVKKFCICTSLSVEPQDGYPKNICGFCHTRLNELHDFQKQCVDSVQKFQDMVAANTFSVDVNIEADDQNLTFEDEARLDFDPLLDQKLELVENVEPNPFDEKNIFSSDSSSSESEYDSKDCDNAADATSDSDDDKPLALRQIKEEPCSNDETLLEPIKPKRKRIPAAERHLHRIIECHICHQKFKKSKNYQDHMKYHNDKLPHQCTIETCRKGFSTENALRIHIEHCHAETIDSIPCPEQGCQSTFPRTRQLNNHLKTVHKMDKEALLKQRSFPCPDCDKVFRVPIALKKHMYKHNGEELPFPCNICGKRFVINSELKCHLMRHAGIKNFICPYCGAGKTTRQELNQHINTHTQEKKYNCDYCDHVSTNKQAMTNHMKVVHENKREFACQYCGKTFGKTNACKMHELRHTGDMPYRCSICEKGFLYAKILTIHLKTHEKWKREKKEVPADKKRKRKVKTEGGESVKEKKPPRNKVPKIPRIMKTPRIPAKRKETDGQLQPPLHSMVHVEPVVVRQNPRHVERVDISQLAGTFINPISAVQLPSWMPQDDTGMTTEYPLSQDNPPVAAEFPFTCPDCGQGFNFSGNLKTHYRIVHEGIKDYACRYCERRFGKALKLKYHEMTHTGEKPHACTLCDFKCISPDSLKRHMKVHDKPPKEKKAKGKKVTSSSGTPRSQVDPAIALAAREELEMHERKKLDEKREAEQKRQAIAEAAKEQLTLMQKQEADIEASQH